ncbi:MAG: DUF2975 domain-containing protein [Oscillospiraceae bacterium]
MKSDKKSLALTIALVWICTALACALLFAAPWLSRLYADYVKRPELFAPLCAALYLSLIPEALALGRLHGLLGNLCNGEVFTRGNCDNLRTLSYCCFAAGAIFIALCFWIPTALLLAFAACFMGLMLRVLKNVFVQAVALREENDAVI